MEQPTNGSNGARRDARRLRNGLVWTAVLAALLLGIGLAVPDLREVLDRASKANLGWLGLAVALELASCLGYVGTVRLVLSRGPARMVRRLAWAEMAFGAVVPVGGAGPRGRRTGRSGVGDGADRGVAQARVSRLHRPHARARTGCLRSRGRSPTSSLGG